MSLRALAESVLVYFILESAAMVKHLLCGGLHFQIS